MDGSKCLQCPLSKAPECFKSTLIRALELGEDNFVPTNWRGFSDYFHLQSLKEAGAQNVVDTWANRHPCRQENTLLKVVEYAQSTEHRKLLESLEQVLKDHLVPEHVCTDDPTKCFTVCHKCSAIPSLLHRSNSRSTDDLHKQKHSTGSIEEKPSHRHRRTHSLPEHICDCQHCSECHGHNSITNIYHVSCCCQSNPILPSATPATGYVPSALPGRSFLPISSQDEALHRLVATESAPTSPFVDSKTATFVIPPHDQQRPHCSSQARHRHVHCPRHSTPHPHKFLKHTQSSAEIERRRVSGSGSQFCREEGCPNCALGRSSIGEGVVGRGGRGENEEEGGEMDRVEEDVRGRSGEGGGGGGGRGGGEGGGRREGNGGDGGRVHEKEREAGMNERKDVMQEFGHRLFDTPPYNLMQRFYNSSTREAIILFFAGFLMYNGLRAILQTICENGGLQAIFIDIDKTLVEATRSFVIFLIRILIVVISPLCLVVHIGAIAAKPRIPKTTFRETQAIGRMFAVHRSFSPHYEVQLLQNQPKNIFVMSEVMTKRHIYSIWMSILNALLFTSLLLYLGVVRLSTKEVTKAGVCQFLTVSTVYLPVLQKNIYSLELLDCALTLGVVLSIDTIKDYYYYENRIAMYSVTVGREAEKLYKEIRRRWILLDLYCYLTAGGLIAIAQTLASLQKTIIPDPSIPLQPKDLLNWFFWAAIVSLLSFLGKSSNRLVKKASLVAYILTALLMNSVNLQIETIPPETMNVVFVIFLFTLVLNLLLSLCSCHFHHYNHTKSWGSLLLFLLSVSLIFLLPLAVVWIIYREMVHLATFVQW